MISRVGQSGQGSKALYGQAGLGVGRGELLDSAMSEKTILKALRGEVQKKPPVWMMRQAGRYLPEYRATRKDNDGSHAIKM